MGPMLSSFERPLIITYLNVVQGPSLTPVPKAQPGGCALLEEEGPVILVWWVMVAGGPRDVVLHGPLSSLGLI